MKSGARIRLAAPLDPDNLPPALAARVTEQVEAGFDPVSGSVLARRRRRLGALVLSDRTVPGRSRRRLVICLPTQSRPRG